VLIVGGGLAGLRVLDLLRKEGREARLFEASKVVGGRIRTLRSGLPEGLWAELGAERVPDGHARLQALIRELGLELLDYPTFEGRLLLRRNGRFHDCSSPVKTPPELLDDLNAREREVPLFRLHAMYCHEDEPVATDDPRNGMRYLEDRGMSAAGRSIAGTLSYLPLERMGAHAFWKATIETRKAGRFRTLAGGVDQLTRRLAKRHEDRIQAGTVIRSLTLRENEVTLEASDGATWRGSVAVLALPHRPLLQLDIRPGRPSVMERGISCLAVAHELKVHATYRSADLAAQGIQPWIMGFDFPRMTWPSAASSPDGRRVLNAMAVREDIAQVKAATDASPDGLLKLMASRLPQISSFGPSVFAHDFSEDPLIGGAYVYATPGAAPTRLPVRSGPLVIAGSDQSSLSGWMEGALASAESAVKEILTS
jgi:monoamine oxidase